MPPPIPAGRVIAVIQARTGSSRLPGKVLRPLGDRAVLDWVVRAGQSADGVDGVVIATSTAPGDDPIVQVGERLGVPVVRGSEDDVLSRFLTAVDEHPCDAVVRLTSDCPLLDPALIGQTVALWRADPSPSTTPPTTLVRSLPRGLDVEVASSTRSGVSRRRRPATTATHVTSGLYSRPGESRLTGVVVRPAANDLRITLRHGRGRRPDRGRRRRTGRRRRRPGATSWPCSGAARSGRPELRYRAEAPRGGLRVHAAGLPAPSAAPSPRCRSPAGLVLCDAAAATGLGHFVRCTALAGVPHRRCRRARPAPGGLRCPPRRRAGGVLGLDGARGGWEPGPSRPSPAPAGSSWWTATGSTDPG